MMDNTDRFMDQAITNRLHHSLLVFLLMALHLVLPAQRDWQWGQAFGGAFDEDIIGDMVVDTQGHTYIVANTGLGVKIEDSVYNGYGYGDMLLISYDCQGNLRWFHILGSNDPNRGEGGEWRLAVGENKLYVTGRLRSGPQWEYNFHFIDSVFTEDEDFFFIAQLSLEGELLDVKRYYPGHNKNIEVYELAKRGPELCIAFGSEAGTLGGHTLPVTGFYVAIADTYGVIQDVWQYGEITNDLWTTGIGIDDQGNVIIGGYGTGPFEIGGQSRPAGAFVARFSPQGQLQWLEGSEQGTSSSPSYSMTFEGMTVNGDNVYACGSFVNGVVLFGDTINNKSINAGSTFIVVDFANQSYKITNKAWSVSKLVDIQHDPTTSQLVTTGYITGTYIIDGDTIVGRSTYEPVVFFLDEDLELQEYLHLETYGDFDSGEKLRIDPNGNVYLAGVFSGSLYFDNDTLHKVGGGAEDIFLAKYGMEQCVDTSTGTQTPTLPTGAFGLLAYPNPATTHLTVKWQSATPGNHTLLLTDMQGRPVQRVVVSGQSGTFRLSTASVSTGLYYLQLQGADGRQAGQMVVVQR